MSDIKESDDTIDVEYFRRLQSITTKEELRDLLKDYEEFIPYQLQKFREADDKEFRALMIQANQYMRDIVDKRKIPEDPTEVIMLLQPPILTIIRGFARQWNAENPGKKPLTWGAAFMRFANQGLLPKLEAMANAQMKQVIDVAEKNREE
jgi:hypothetical protein